MSDNRLDALKPSISIIIVAYNTNELLVECIDSLSNQTEKNFEVIVVDNGKNDKVVNKLLDLPIIYIKTPINLILSEGRNIGVHFAKAPIVAFLDDDAIAHPNYVKNITKAFNSENIFALRGKVLPKNSDSYINSKPHYNLGDDPMLINYIDTEGNSAFLKKIYQDENGMNTLLFGGEGFELSYRLHKKYGFGKIAYNPDIIIYHDYASTEGKNDAKQNRHNLMNEYLRYKHNDIDLFRRPERKLFLKDNMKNITNNVPLISICIPTYNRAEFLRRAIESVFNQTNDNFEIVVIDDGSTDNTANLIESFNSPKIRYIFVDHKGAPAARNKAVRAAQGEYILWLDSDDEMATSMLEEYNQAISSNPGFNIFYCNNTRVFDENGDKQQITYKDISGKLSPDQLLLGPQIANCGALIKKSLFEKAGFYNEDFKRAHDFEFWVKSLPYAYYKQVNKNLYFQHFHNQGNLSPIYHEKTDLSYEKRIINSLVDNYSIEEMFSNVDWQILNENQKDEGKYLAYKVYAEAFYKWSDNERAVEYINRLFEFKKSEEGMKLLKKIQNEIKWSQKSKLPVSAIISAFNEGDIIYNVVKDLVDQDIDVYFIDNNSTDNTVDEVKKLLDKGVVHIERFPEDCGYDIPSDKYVWRYLLKRKEEISNELGKGWYIHADADEFRESPWKGLNLRQGIEKVETEGFNAINFKIYDFKPTDNSFENGKDVRDFIKYYSEDIHPYNNFQVKAWKNFGQEINLWESGGHNIQFLGRKVFPLPFILRHYSVRSQHHGIKKIFNERKKRYDQTERDAQWHQHYDYIKNEDHNLLMDKSQLKIYDRDQVCENIQSGRYNFEEEVSQIEAEEQTEDSSDAAYYEFPRPEVQAMVNPNSKYILDVGCARGRMASELKTKLNAEVWGIEPFEDAAEEAERKLDKVVSGKVEEAIDKLPDHKFDSIIFADVLEHLENPEDVLRNLKSKFSANGEIIVSIPNVNHFSIFKNLLEGEWKYEDAGILDKTHLRFFTKKSVLRMMKSTGYEVTEMNATSFGNFNLSNETIEALKKDGIDATDLNQNLNHYQYLMKARPELNSKKSSIITPIFNQLDYTKAFIASVFKYTHSPFELILIDNGSSKETIEFLEELQNTDDSSESNFK